MPNRFLWQTLATRSFLLVLLAGTACFAEPNWETDFEAAKKSAKDSSKDLLINFTGSDWCGFCITLKDEIFSQEAFQTGTADDFVLVEIDFPRDKKLDEELQKQNDNLRGRFGIEGFPSIFLTDASGLPFAQIPNQPGLSPKEFVSQMQSHQKLRKKRDEHFTKGEKKKGLERAKELDAGLDALDQEIVDRFYGKTVDEIVELDKKDTLKYKSDRNFSKTLRELEEKIAKLARSGDHEALEKAIDSFIKDRKLKDEQKQETLMLKLGLFGKDQLDELVQLLDEVVKLEPKSDHAKEAEEIKLRVEQFKKQTAARTEAAK